MIFLPLPLYIDPGTGSMLFSVFIGAVATLYFLIRAAILKVQLLIHGKKAREAEKAGRKNLLFTAKANNTGMYSSLFSMNLKNVKLKSVILRRQKMILYSPKNIAL